MRLFASQAGSLFALLAVLGAACDGDSRYYGTTRPKHGPDEVWYNLGAEPEWLDPSKASDNASGTVVLNLFSGLAQAHPVTLEPMPDVAKGWEIFDEGRRYVFHLRESTWSDGVPVTAHDFVFSWRRLLDPKTASRYASFLYPVLYAEEVNRRALQVAGVPEGTTKEAVRAWVGELSEIEKVVLAPESRTVFLHLKSSPQVDRQALSRTLIPKLRAKPLLGSSVRPSITQPAVLGVRALSDHKLEVRLTDPLPYFLSVVCFYSTMPLPRHLFKKLEARGIPEALWTRAEHMVNNGAYLLEKWAFRQYILLQKNRRYWDAEHVRTARIRLSIVESYNTTLNLYKAGELDHIGESALPSEFMDHLQHFADFHRANYLGTYFLWVNTASPPLDNPKVREALSLAVDRQSLVKYVTRAGQVPSRDLVPDGVAGYRGLRRKLFDPEAARAALREAGYGPDSPLPPISYSYNTAEAHKQVAEAIQQMWKKHLGIEVTIENQEWKVYLKRLEKTEHQLARLGWIGDYADPNTFLEILTSTTGNNHSNWHSLEFDQMLERANGTLDPARRLEMLHQAEAFAMRANPVIPLYVYTRSELVKPYVRGAFLNYMKRTYLKYLWIDERYYGGTPEPLQDVRPPLLVPDPAPALALAPAMVEPDAGATRHDAGVDAGGRAP